MYESHCCSKTSLESTSCRVEAVESWGNRLVRRSQSVSQVTVVYVCVVCVCTNNALHSVITRKLIDLVGLTVYNYLTKRGVELLLYKMHTGYIMF